MKLTKETLKQIIKEELDKLQEDGHEDVSSARRKLKTTIEDASEILQSLESTPEQELPSWWMSKITIVGEYINKARDYLLVSGDSMTESHGDMFDPYNPEGHPEPETPTMSGSESANMLRKAVVKFAMDNPQLDNPKATVMAIVSELIK
jgi:hypothetical protein